MKVRDISRSKTFYSNPFIEDYYNTSKLDVLRTYKPQIEEVERAIENKKNFKPESRTLLKNVLLEQYKKSGIEEANAYKVYEHIRSLEDQNTFTVTTGQQVHLGLGPMYVLYKALDAIAMCNELKEKYPERNFVPLFWMASEDHDLEEIAEIPLFGTTKKWETSQKGAVGRMSTNGVVPFFESIKGEYNFNPEQIDFLDACIHSYKTSSTIAGAFMLLLHHYLGKLGIVILDPDSELLKKSFIPVLKDELQTKNYNALKSSTQQLEDIGYNKQLLVRECNLFDLSDGDRVKIDSQTFKQFSDEELDVYANDNAYNLSPNAAIRPLYQEWVLPNLIYVGGGSELKYWMQLKEMFDKYNMPVPLLHLRKSNLILPIKYWEELDDNILQLLFKDEVTISRYLNKEADHKMKRLSDLRNKVECSLSDYIEFAESEIKGLSLAHKSSKIRLKLNDLFEFTTARFNAQTALNANNNKLMKVKHRFFDESSIQERNDHLLMHANTVKGVLLNMDSHFGLKKSKKLTIFYV